MTTMASRVARGSQVVKVSATLLACYLLLFLGGSIESVAKFYSTSVGGAVFAFVSLGVLLVVPFLNVVTLGSRAVPKKQKLLSVAILILWGLLVVGTVLLAHGGPPRAS